MKKAITLLLSVALVSSAFAQYDNDQQRGRDNDYGYSKTHDRDYGHDRGGKFYYFTARERDMQIAQINREYSYKMQAVRNKFFMNRRHKERQLVILEQERSQEIRMVWFKFNDRMNRGDGWDRRNDHKW
jgi:hypothetical protein